MKVDVQLPYNYEPRPYQLPFLQSFDHNIHHGGKIRKFVLVWHRRAGKEKTLVNVMAKEMEHRVGAYYYFFPKFKQGKKILWEGMDRQGFKFLGHFPKHLLKSKPNDTEMKLKYKNGSLFQVIGTDNYDSIVGTNPLGCVFSEYSLQDPGAWDFMRPVLAENNGFAVFNFTPRGENHGWDIYDMAETDPDNFYSELLSVTDTHAIKPEVLGQERKEIIRQHGNDAIYQQEYNCSFTVPLPGSYYAPQMMDMVKEERICHVPYEPSVPVDTYWDLGIDDSMTIGYFQIVNREVRIIDYTEGTGEGLPFYFKIMQEKGYVYGEHYGPHDITVRELGTGKSRQDTAKGLGVTFKVAPKLSISDGISAVRMVFKNLWMDKVKCHRLINAAKSYHKEYDEKNKCFKNHPEHDWSSHAADMLRTFATSFNLKKLMGMARQSPFSSKQKLPPTGTVARANVTRQKTVNPTVAS